MSAETLRLISVIAFSIAAASLIVGAILWFTLNIQNVIGFLTGRNARKATESLGSMTGRTLYKRPNGNAAKPSKTAKPAKAKKGQPKKKAEPKIEPTTPLDSADVVAPTTMLESEPTTALAEDTALLDDGGPLEGTMLLDADSAKHASFVITESIVMVHTDEDIKLQNLL